MKRIPLTQGKEAHVDDQDYEHLIPWHWVPAVHGKYVVRTGGHYMHTEVARLMGFPPELIPDHKNENGLDNQRENLRPATKSQNMMNRGLDRNNKSGFKGVCWYKARGKWICYITVMNRRLHLGYFDDKIEAAKAYNAAAKKHFGEFAWLNLIPGED